jgi:glycosyltransferase involved in cell wall biosynthesis
MPDNSYVIISASRNEEAYVEGLIDCIAAQTIPPLRWVIVDDGSTDATYAKSLRRAAALDWLQVVKMPGGRPRSFASQVYAAQHGAEVVRGLDFAFIGFLDADIRVQPDYYEQLLARFHADPKLGLAGGIVVDQYAGRVEDIRKGSEDFHVAGGVQFFRRECFERIGGYVAIQGGGQDTIADIMTLMHGWTLRAFPELPAVHLRPEGFDRDNAFQRGLKWGRKFYLIGYHPLYYFFQSVRRSFRRPFLISGLCQLWGYAVACARRERRPVSVEFVQFLRRLQLRRLRKVCLRF